jgi:hypothetical protein
MVTLSTGIKLARCACSILVQYSCDMITFERAWHCWPNTRDANYEARNNHFVIQERVVLYVYLPAHLRPKGDKNENFCLLLSRIGTHSVVYNIFL